MLFTLFIVDQTLGLVETVTDVLVQRKRQKNLEAFVAQHPESYVIPRNAARIHLDSDEAIRAEDGDAQAIALGEDRYKMLSGRFPDAWQKMVTA
jgi:hypothetical protein